MKYQWLENKTCTELSQELGIEVKSITKGGIGDENMPIQGIEIEFAKEPTAEQLARLDMMLPGLKRAGGQNFADAMSELKDRVSTLEAAKATLEL